MDPPYIQFIGPIKNAKNEHVSFNNTHQGVVVWGDMYQYAFL